MNRLFKNPFTFVQKVAVVALCVVLAGSFFSCVKRGDSSEVPQHVTGTVIGRYYYGGNASFLVQVDKKYPIGKTFEYTSSPGIFCIELPEYGTYDNMIQVQPYLPLPGWPKSYLDNSGWSEVKSIIDKRISFSYREYRRPEEGDDDGDWLLFMFALLPSNGLCTFPDFPTYIITDCTILK